MLYAPLGMPVGRPRLKIFRIVFVILFTVALQGCAVLVPLTFIAVGMGTGTPPQPKAMRVQMGDVTVFVRDDLSRLNCLAYFDDNPNLGCAAVSFEPLAERSLNERLALGEAAVGAVKGRQVMFISHADQRVVNVPPVRFGQTNETVILGYIRQ